MKTKTNQVAVKLLFILFAALSLAACNKAPQEQEQPKVAPSKSAAATPASASVDADDSLQQVKQRGYLRVAVFSDKPPFGYVDAEGKSKGYDVELAKRLAKELFGDETKLEYVLTEAQHRIEVLKSNKVDITLANFTITPERATQVDFGEPYLKTAIGVVSPLSNSISDLAQLQDKTIIVNKGTTAENYFVKNYPQVKQLKFDHNSEAFAALKDGRGAGLAHDETFLYAWIRENPDYSVAVTGIGPVEFIGPAVKKGNQALLDWVNTEIVKLQQQEFFHQAYDSAVRPFFGESVDPDNIVIDASNLAK